MKFNIALMKVNFAALQLWNSTLHLWKSILLLCNYEIYEELKISFAIRSRYENQFYKSENQFCTDGNL